MKQFLYKCLLFLPVCILVYILGIILWGEIMPSTLKPNLVHKMGGYGHMLTRMQEAKVTENVDILFVGSSHAYRGFDPRLFANHGYSSFNLGSSSQTPLQSELLLKRYLERLNPDVVVFEVWRFNFSSDGVESTLDLLANDKIDQDATRLMFATFNFKTLNTYLFALYKDLGTDKREIIEDPVKKEDIYIRGGYVERELSYYSPKSQKEEYWVLNTKQYTAFLNAIRLIRESGAKVILVETPITKTYDQRIAFNVDFDSLMSRSGNHYNFQNLVALDDSLHFYDNSHLNQRGVEIFNRKLIDVLKNDELLP